MEDIVEARFTQRFRPAKVLEVFERHDIITHYKIEYLKSKSQFKVNISALMPDQG